MSVTIQQRASVRGQVWPSTLRRRARKLLAAVGTPEAELSLLLTDDAEIRELNVAWRQKDAATDVLSFPQDHFPGTPRHLGDIVVSLETAARQATRGALPRLGAPGPWTLLDEVTFLLLHGVLHLLGHDHTGDAEAEVMEAREAELLPALRGR